MSRKHVRTEGTTPEFVQTPDLKRQGLLAGVLALVAAVWAYWPGITAFFTGEELNSLYLVRTTDDPFSMWSGRDRQPGFLRPMVPLTLWVWQKVWGTEPVAFHLLNFGIHLLNSCLLWSIARDMFAMQAQGKGARPMLCGLIAGIWFLLWPSHSEPVVWIAAITDMGAAVFSLACIWAAFRWEKTRSRWLLGLPPLFLVLALATKESALPVPPVVLLLQCYRNYSKGSWTWRSFAIPLVLFGILLGYMQVRFHLTGAYLGGYGDQVHRNVAWDTLKHTVAGNLTNTFLPIPHLTTREKWSSLALLAMVSGGMFLKAKARGHAILGATAAACAILLLVPVLNLSIGSWTEQQRFAYLPSAFGVIFMAAAWNAFGAGERFSLWGAGAIALVCSGVLYSYNRNWHTAGVTARRIVEGARDLPAARRYYVLSAPDSFREAFVFRNGLEIGTRVFDTYRGDMRVALRLMYWNPDQQLRARKVDANMYEVTLEAAPKTVSHPPWLMINGDAQESLEWFRVQHGGGKFVVQLVGFDPKQDRVAYLNGSAWVLVD